MYLYWNVFVLSPGSFRLHEWTLRVGVTSFCSRWSTSIELLTANSLTICPPFLLSMPCSLANLLHFILVFGGKLVRSCRISSLSNTKEWDFALLGRGGLTKNCDRRLLWYFARDSSSASVNSAALSPICLTIECTKEVPNLLEIVAFRSLTIACVRVFSSSSSALLDSETVAGCTGENLGPSGNGSCRW